MHITRRTNERRCQVQLANPLGRNEVCAPILETQGPLGDNTVLVSQKRDSKGRQPNWHVQSQHPLATQAMYNTTLRRTCSSHIKTWRSKVITSVQRYRAKDFTFDTPSHQTPSIWRASYGAATVYSLFDIDSQYSLC